MAFSFAYIVFWPCKGRLAIRKLFRDVGVCGGVGLGWTESNVLQAFWCSLESGLSSACQLVGRHQSSEVPTVVRAVPRCLAGAAMGFGEA